MAKVPEHHVRETTTLQVARFIVKYRAAVAAFLILTTLFFLYPTVNAISTGLGFPLPGPVVRVDASERALWPDHPFIHAQDKFSKTFGSSAVVAIALVVEEGTIFTPETLRKIQRITQSLDGVEAGPDLPSYDSHTDERDEYRDQLEEANPDISPHELLKLLDRRYPPYPVNHDRVQSLYHGSTRVVTIEPDGAITSDVLIKKEPKTQADADRIRDIVRQNPPYIFGRLVSPDEKGAFIMANFISDRLTSREVYQAVFEHVQRIKAVEEDDHHKIYISGMPIHTGWIIKHAFEIGLFVGLTVLVTFLLLLVYFRRLHGVLIPFIAALATAIWGLGFTGWTGITFDPLVLVIPMIITARAVSHTVQMAERFFEDYEILMPHFDNDPEKAKIEAATVAMAELIVPGSLGIVTDVLGLLVILITSIPQMRDLATFGAFWVITIIFTVEILHPVMICYLPPPHEPEHYLPGFMVRLMGWIGRTVTDPVGKYVVAGGAVIILSACTYIVFTRSTIGEANPGSFLLWPEHEYNVARRRSRERHSRPGADPTHGAVRALDEDQHQHGDLGLDRADHQGLLATEPLRGPEVVLPAAPPRHGAQRAVPAQDERAARLPAPLHDRRQPRRQPVFLLPGPPRRDHRAGRRGVEPVHQAQPDRRGEPAPRQGQGQSRGRLLLLRQSG
jgi:hypothetical protein